ncbi:hypothetical protein [Arenibacter sp. F20364]|nr:hypothetical protein [Arenibacter sp. F20364]MCK0188434.1 hypothetical protein [Arenibacter sp. F20364]
MDVYVVAYPNGVVVLITVRAMQPSVNGELSSFLSVLLYVIMRIKNQM